MSDTSSQRPEEAWIDVEHPPPEVALIGRVTCPLTPGYHTWLFQRDRWLILRTRSETSGSEGQRVVPIDAVPWLHQAITTRFWRAPDEGGLPSGVYHIQERVGGELLELRRAWGIAKGEPGFTLTNFDRLSPSGYPQEYTMSDALLIDGGLLELLRSVGDTAHSA